MMRGRIGDPKTSAPISVAGFLRRRTAVESFPSYFMIEQAINLEPTDAPFGLVGDDNGPGSEPTPQDRIGLFMAVMLSRQRPPAALGKPSFPYFTQSQLST
ncbi:hypothetical protein THAOC_12586 [Thalassiosira oceanica]|uniref:Uncharacterized protein n=1 Tax=Thalassiosira oceanica TaxID=159749 RepID=K0T7P1_THAOC|nr:hypothetical protein THAOC_12586 [Thalassiosira oceanica]|eukprot:EJK66492.1 hypothetical protein THAOC_12586 [Thalassiosira oceanica]